MPKISADRGRNIKVKKVKVKSPESELAKKKSIWFLLVWVKVFFSSLAVHVSEEKENRGFFSANVFLIK